MPDSHECVAIPLFALKISAGVLEEHKTVDSLCWSFAAFFGPQKFLYWETEMTQVAILSKLARSHVRNACSYLQKKAQYFLVYSMKLSSCWSTQSLMNEPRQLLISIKGSLTKLPLHSRSKESSIIYATSKGIKYFLRICWLH